MSDYLPSAASPEPEHRGDGDGDRERDVKREVDPSDPGRALDLRRERIAGTPTPLPAPRRPTGGGWVAPGQPVPDADADSDFTWSRAPEPAVAWPAVPPTQPPVQPPGWGPPPGYPPGYGPPPGSPPGYPPAYPSAYPGYGAPPGSPPVPGYGYDQGWATWGGPMAPPTTGDWMGFDPWKPAPRWGMPDIVLGLLAFIFGSVAFALPAVALNASTGIIGIVGLFGSWVGMLGFLTYVSRKKGLGSFREDFGFRFQWVDPFLGFGMGFATIILAGIVSNIVAQLFDAERGNNSDTVFADKSHAAIVIITALMASIGAPLVEELFFRGLTLRAIERRLGPVAGILGSSFVFGMLHWQAGSLGSTLSLVSAIAIFGLVFAFLTRWQARLGPAIFAHMTINSIASAVAVYTYFGGTFPT